LEVKIFKNVKTLKTSQEFKEIFVNVQ